MDKYGKASWQGPDPIKNVFSFNRSFAENSTNQRLKKVTWPPWLAEISVASVMKY